MREFGDIQTAVVGCGNWGRNLVRNFFTLSDLRVCCEVDPSRRQNMEMVFPGVRVTDSFENVLDDSCVDVVTIAVPSPLHADMAVAALEAGKHVLVEKPMALSVRDAERIARTVEATGLVLGVGHLLEYHPAVEWLKKAVEGGELGDVYYCYSQRVNLGRLRPDENALWSLAPHDISMILHLLDEEPHEVHATGRAFLQPNLEDVCFIMMKFPSGRMAHLQVSWLDPHKERKLTLVGSKKMAVFDDMAAREKIRVYDKGVDLRQREDGFPGFSFDHLAVREGDILIPRLLTEEPLTREVREFLSAVRAGEPPRADVRDGMRVVEVLERAHASLLNGREASPGPAVLAAMA